MRYLSVCSGIEAATVAWHPLGWEPVAFSEIEPFPCALLAHHYPKTPNLGDMTKIHESEVFRDAAIDLLVGGTPCQSFSVAGLRKGMADPRGNLALHFLKLADAARPRWLVWENVPGVLSSNKGRDFGSFLGALGELGYGWAYRVLDAQYAGLAQRRKRVFVVASAGDWRRAAAVLFERHSLSGDPAPSREEGPGVAGALSASLGRRCGVPDGGDTAGQLIAHTLRGEGFDASEDGTGRGIPLVASCKTAREGKGPDSDMTTTLIPFDTNITSRENRANPQAGDPCHPIAAGAHPPAVAYGFRHRASAHDQAPVLEEQIPSLRAADDDGQSVYVDLQNMRLGREDLAGTLMTTEPSRGGGSALLEQSRVRRLTPRECERLQGFPDDYTAIPYRGKPAADGPRYKALGNSMAVPAMRWIGERIEAVESI